MSAVKLRISNTLKMCFFLQDSSEVPVPVLQQRDRVRDPEGSDSAQSLYRPAEERFTAVCSAVCGTVPAVVCTGVSRVCRH